MSWEIRVVYEPTQMTIGVVHDSATFEFEDPLSDTGAAKVTIAEDLLPRQWATSYVKWVFYRDGEPIWAFLPEAVLDKQVDPEETRMVEVVGRGVGQVLEWAVIVPNYTNQDTRDWASMSRPQVYYRFFTQAQARGALLMSYADFDETVDSDGTTWGTIIDGSTGVGQDMLSLIKEWAPIHPFDWHMNYDYILQARVAWGEDRTSEVVIFPGDDLESLHRTTVLRELRNVMLVKATDSITREYEDVDSVSTWGRRERWVDSDEAINASSSSAVGEPLLDVLAQPFTERRVTIDPYAAGAHLPWRDFFLGDLIAVADDEGGERGFYRVLAIGVRVEESGREYYEVTLENILERILDQIESTSSATSSTSGGSTLVYVENNGNYVFDTTPEQVLNMDLQAIGVANGRAGFNIKGVASGALTLTVEVLKGSDVIKTYVIKVWGGGEHTVGLPFILVGIPDGSATWRLRIHTNSGTFTVTGAGNASWWVEARNLAGGLSESSPDVVVTQDMAPWVQMDDSAAVAFQTPVDAEAVDDMAMADMTDPGAEVTRDGDDFTGSFEEEF